MVLIYNLIHRPSAALLDCHGSETEKLTRLLGSWARAADGDSIRYLDGWDEEPDDVCPPALVYILEHQYADRKLSFLRLKETDQVLFTQLHDACQRAGFDIFLTNVEKRQKEFHDVGDYDDYYGGRYKHGNIQLDQPNPGFLEVVNSEGNVVERDIPFPETMLVQADTFCRDPDEEYYKGVLGSDGKSNRLLLQRNSKSFG